MERALRVFLKPFTIKCRGGQLVVHGVFSGLWKHSQNIFKSGISLAPGSIDEDFNK